MLPALPRCSRWAYLSLKNYPSVSAFPDSTFGSACTSTFRGLLGVYSRCGLHTRAVTNFVTAIRGLQTFRRLHACSGCFRLERLPGGACTHWKAPPCHGAHPKADLFAARSKASARARKDSTGIPAEVASEDREQDRPYVRHCLPVPGDFTQQLDLFEKIALACDHGA